MDNLSIDIVSDLHIDQWDNTIESKHPHGIRAYKPYDFNDSHSDILVIAGDVSDDLDITLNFIDKISSKYKNRNRKTNKNKHKKQSKTKKQ